MIRRADASDISQVAALYHAVWHETQAPFMPQAEIARGPEVHCLPPHQHRQKPLQIFLKIFRSREIIPRRRQTDLSEVIGKIRPMGRISMLSQKLRNAIYQFRGWERRRRICNAMLLDIALKFRKPFRWDRCEPRAHANIGNKLAPQVR